MTVPFLRHFGRAASLPLDNIDTDVIIPMQQLLSVPRSERERCGFNALRYDEQGNQRGDFPLNTTKGRGASVIVAGRNFGCGSSREGAVYALAGLGVRVMVASSYGDIFYSNCLKNGILPIMLSQADLDSVHEAIAGSQEPVDAAIDLQAQRIALSTGLWFPFEIDPAHRQRLIDGTDEVALTLQAEDDIRRFEQGDRMARPWAQRADA